MTRRSTGHGGSACRRPPGARGDRRCGGMWVIGSCRSSAGSRQPRPRRTAHAVVIVAVVSTPTAPTLSFGKKCRRPACQGHGRVDAQDGSMLRTGRTIEDRKSGMWFTPRGSSTPRAGNPQQVDTALTGQQRVQEAHGDRVCGGPTFLVNRRLEARTPGHGWAFARCASVRLGTSRAAAWVEAVLLLQSGREAPDLAECLRCACREPSPCRSRGEFELLKDAPRRSCRKRRTLSGRHRPLTRSGLDRSAHQLIKCHACATARTSRVDATSISCACPAASVRLAPPAERALFARLPAVTLRFRLPVSGRRPS